MNPNTLMKLGDLGTTTIIGVKLELSKAYFDGLRENAKGCSNCIELQITLDDRQIEMTYDEFKRRVFQDPVKPVDDEADRMMEFFKS